jgi:hypothetical protein
MQKIISLFKRNYEGDRQIRDEVVEGAEWVLAGEGTPTVKMDGTCCMMRDGQLYRRYDRKLTKKNKRNKSPYTEDMFKPAPEGWEAAEAEANTHTGHWPGWVPVSDDPQDKWHRKAFENYVLLENGTYELVGKKVQGNPYKIEHHELRKHGECQLPENPPPLRDFVSIREFLSDEEIEGIVWHHPDGRMVKIKRRDFGLPWPVKTDD